VRIRCLDFISPLLGGSQLKFKLLYSVLTGGKHLPKFLLFKTTTIAVHLQEYFYIA